MLICIGYSQGIVMNTGRDLLKRIDAHRMQLAPHRGHRGAVEVLLCETEDSEYMTGAQRVQFAREALGR